MNIYTQAVPQAMRDAHRKVVEMRLPPMRKAGQKRGSLRAALSVPLSANLFPSFPQSASQVLENTGNADFDPHRPHQKFSFLTMYF
jgi:hypothetical protein